jgi:CRISPR-associated protein Cmr1
MHREDCDPVDTTLQFRDYDRWASSLILRPLLCEGGQAVGIAMPLRVRSLPDGGFVLVPKNFSGVLKAPEPVQVWLDQGEADDIEPLRDKKGKGQINPVFAFLNTLE